MVDRLSGTFAALSDPTRRDIVARLALGDATVNALAEPYDMSVQAVSKHLKVLEQAGLVSRSRAGNRRPVRLETEALDQLTSWVERYRRLAEERYRRLDEVLRAMPDEPPLRAPDQPPGKEPTHDRSHHHPRDADRR